jgi:hypothetical protein
VAKGMYSCGRCSNSKKPLSNINLLNILPVKESDIITSLTFMFTSLDVFVRLHCLLLYLSTQLHLLQEHPGCKVFGQTASTDHHSELTDIGIIPSLKGSTISQKAPYVIFCAPPSRSDDYPGDLRWVSVIIMMILCNRLVLI